MNIIKIEKNLKSKDTILRKKNIYIMNDSQSQVFSNSLKRSNISNAITIVPISKILKQFDGTKIPPKIIIIRAGGIGDLIAISSLVKFIQKTFNKQVTFITQAKYIPVLNWFETPVMFHNPDKEIGVYDINFQLNPKVQYICFDNEIESSNTNWFHIFFKNFNVDYSVYGRPALAVPDNLPKCSNNIKDKNAILLTLKSTANIRTIEFEPVYKALKPVAPNHTIYIHETNLTTADIIFIKNVNDKKIKIIKTGGLSDFLNDVYFAQMLISTDTGSLHFREGVKKPAIGLYGAFSAECRTKYYKYTKSFNIVSDCNYQPCFKHTKHFDDVCSNFKGNSNVPPCFDQCFNKTLVSQLTKIFLNNL